MEGHWSKGQSPQWAVMPMEEEEEEEEDDNDDCGLRVNNATDWYGLYKICVVKVCFGSWAAGRQHPPPPFPLGAPMGPRTDMNFWGRFQYLVTPTNQDEATWLARCFPTRLSTAQTTLSSVILCLWLSEVELLSYFAERDCPSVLQWMFLFQ